MTLINAKLKCGCSGLERLDHDSVGVRFLVQSPCAQHRAHQWLHRSEADVEWRDSKQWKYWTRALELEKEQKSESLDSQLKVIGTLGKLALELDSARFIEVAARKADLNPVAVAHGVHPLWGTGMAARE